MAAPIRGTFLAPGVSKNGRLYTKETIKAAVARMQERIADPNSNSITMRSHHAAGDDSTKIAAYVTAVNVESDGTATWEAHPVGTQAGKDIAAAAKPGPDGKRALANVSIRGWWMGPTRMETHDGQQVETADDMEIDGIDFTASPGVAAARIAAFEVAETDSGRTPITESVEALVSKTVTDEASISVNAYNGPNDVSVAVYGVDNDDLDVAAAQVGAAAKAATQVLDPDQDGDVDLPDGTDIVCPSCEDTIPDGTNFCPDCGAAMESTETTGTSPATEKEIPMGDKAKVTEGAVDDKKVVEGAPVVEDAKVTEPVTETVPVTEPVTEAVTEAAPLTEAINEAVTEAVRTAVTEQVTALATQMAAKYTETIDLIRKEMVTAYGPPRKGLTATLEQAAPEKPVHEMDSDEFNKYASSLWEPLLRKS